MRVTTKTLQKIYLEKVIDTRPTGDSNAGESGKARHNGGNAEEELYFVDGDRRDEIHIVF